MKNVKFASDLHSIWDFLMGHFIKNIIGQLKLLLEN